MALKRQKRAITETETGDIYTGNSKASTVSTTPLANVPDPAIPPKGANVTTPIISNDVPESILFFRSEFDLERLKRRLSEYSLGNDQSNSSMSNTCGDIVSDYEAEFFQKIDSTDPPLSDSFHGSKFYIRACYKVYYDLIDACLNSGRIDFLTLVGTPGTGKSLFYLYVFRRYRLHHPDVPIVAATFDKGRTMIECWKYEPNKDPIRCCKIPKIDGAIHFYDGSPSMLPKYQKMVCFTRPNYKWMDLHRKEQRHKCLWFPPWTLEELMDANDVCDFGLGEETIKNRFNFFGGSARYCLSSEDAFVETGWNQLKRKSLSVDSLDTLTVYLRGENDTLSHQLFHLLPVLYNYFPYISFGPKSFACSPAVDALICKRIVQKQKAKYQELVSITRYIPGAAIIRCRMLVQSAHYFFKQGGSFDIRPLGEAAGCGSAKITIPPGVYKEMQPGCESVDGIAILQDTVLMFRATVTSTHPVNAHGILHDLERLGKFEGFVNGNVKVLLVSVIPTDLKNFPLQQITRIDYNSDDCSVHRMRGLRTFWKQHLIGKDVTTVNRLRAYIADPNIDDRARYIKCLDDFDSRNKYSKCNGKVGEIQQYALVLPEFDKPPNIDEKSSQRNQ